jgi:fermentation-respiration switch protein FrsA (DUF1100 family)
LIALVENEPDKAVLREKARQLVGPAVAEDALSVQLATLDNPWMRFFFSYDPGEALRKLTIPVLALNGSLDRQVPPEQNLPAIRKSLEEAGNEHFEIAEMPGLNHLFQTAKTGAATEYARIEETMSPAVLEKVAAWILKQ